MFPLLALHFAFGVRQLGCKTPSTRDNFSRLRPRFRANSAHNPVKQASYLQPLFVHLCACISLAPSCNYFICVLCWTPCLLLIPEVE